MDEQGIDDTQSTNDQNTSNGTNRMRSTTAPDTSAAVIMQNAA